MLAKEEGHEQRKEQQGLPGHDHVIGAVIDRYRPQPIHHSHNVILVDCLLPRLKQAFSTHSGLNWEFNRENHFNVLLCLSKHAKAGVQSVNTFVPMRSHLSVKSSISCYCLSVALIITSAPRRPVPAARSRIETLRSSPSLRNASTHLEQGRS